MRQQNLIKAGLLAHGWTEGSPTGALLRSPDERIALFLGGDRQSDGSLDDSYTRRPRTRTFQVSFEADTPASVVVAAALEAARAVGSPSGETQ